MLKYQNTETETYLGQDGSKISLREIYRSIENVDDFRNIIEAIVQGQPRIEFRSDNENVIISVLDRLTRIKPVSKEYSCNRIDGSWTSTLNETSKSNNKISVSIDSNEDSYIKLSIGYSEKSTSTETKCHFVEKVLEILCNERLADEVCENHIHALKSKYISIAKVYSRKKNLRKTKDKLSSMVFKTKNCRKHTLNNLLFSANLPLTEMNVILQWADELSEYNL